MGNLVEEPRCVAVWVGNWATEDDLDEYLETQFGSDFGVVQGEAEDPEATVEAERSIRKLLEGFSMAERFIDAAVNTATRRGIATATCVVVYYAARYVGKAMAGRQMQFLGNFVLAQL